MMRAKRWQRYVLVGAVLVGGAMWWAGEDEGAHAQATPKNRAVGTADTRRAMRADLRIHQMQVAADGRAAGVASPGLVLHLDRRQQAGRWKLALTMTGLDRPSVSTPRGASLLDNPFTVSRLEYDEDDGGEPQLYDRAGRRVAVANEAQRRALGVAATLRKTDWDPDVIASRLGRPLPPGGGRVAAGLFADAGQRDGRRQGFERRYGRPVGRVRGLDRFVLSRADETEEVLVAPDSALPAEVNTAARGGLKSRVQLTYDSHPGVGFVRRLLRSEQVSDPARGMRLVTDVEMTNLTVDGGGR